MRPKPDYSVVIVAAHPDDEVIGAGAQIARLGEAVTILYVTDGAPRDLHDALRCGFSSREEYARARRAELAAALNVAGIGMEQTCTLGIVDQEAALNLPALAQNMVQLLDQFRPDVVMTHAYEGGHPDHDATAFAVHAAQRLLRADSKPRGAMLEFTSYHACGDGMSVFEFLPGNGSHVCTYELLPEEQDLKSRMLECFVTQREVLSAFPVEVERTRIAPRYDFARPPHPPPLYYDRFPWGMTSERWRSLARDALRTLGISGKM